MVPWATVKKSTARDRALKLAQYLKCPLSSALMTSLVEAEILKCLRSKSAEEVFGASWYVNELDIFQFPFVPIEGTPQIPNTPQQTTQLGEELSIDIMAGFNSNEGSYFGIYVIDGFNITTKSLLTK